MIKLKKGVRLHGLRPELLLAIIIAEGIYENANESLVITSVIDGKHMRASIHYVGGAVDFRLPTSNEDRMRQRIAADVGGDFDVVLEKTHLHIEWQPKEPY